MFRTIDMIDMIVIHRNVQYLGKQPIYIKIIYVGGTICELIIFFTIIYLNDYNQSKNI